ncbi:uncharacterized protein LOC130693226 [Daphnia carinata]|uniref:uncharacterized protein LOC130693226 n=1 Tax=Daphnia carinata TaxID=120202 RepID=UPI00257F2AEE|nr:uncharacterized protein LOC130693226 [Daphnia carinata]
MDHRHYSPAGLSESELDESSSTASSPMSISSAEASSPYDSSRLNGGDEDPTDSSFSTSVHSPSIISSSPPSPSESLCNNNYANQWSNPYCNATKSVRWFRDDRGLWSERSSSNRRNTNSPYNRNTLSSAATTRLNNASSHKEMSEVLIEAVQREDQVQLRHLLAKSATHVNILGQEGDSALHRSCRQGNLDTVKLLVRYGADPELANREGWSPLHLAAHSGYHDVALYLLSLTRR